MCYLLGRPPGHRFDGNGDSLGTRHHGVGEKPEPSFAGGRVRLIRNGAAASRILDLVEAMHVSRERLLGMLNVPNASIKRKIRQGAMLSQDQSERVFGLLRLIGQVAVMVEHLGDPKEFDAARWVGGWLERPTYPCIGRR